MKLQKRQKIENKIEKKKLKMKLQRRQKKDESMNKKWEGQQKNVKFKNENKLI